MDSPARNPTASLVYPFQNWLFNSSEAKSQGIFAHSFILYLVMSTVTVIKRKRSSQFRLEQLESDEDWEHQEPLDLPEAVGTINHFLNQLEKKNLILCGGGTLRLLSQRSLEGPLRCLPVYDPQTGVLTVKAMASTLHDATLENLNGYSAYESFLPLHKALQFRYVEWARRR